MTSPVPASPRPASASRRPRPRLPAGIPCGHDRRERPPRRPARARARRAVPVSSRDPDLSVLRTGVHGSLIGSRSTSSRRMATRRTGGGSARLPGRYRVRETSISRARYRPTSRGRLEGGQEGRRGRRRRERPRRRCERRHRTRRRTAVRDAARLVRVSSRARTTSGSICWSTTTRWRRFDAASAPALRLNSNR